MKKSAKKLPPLQITEAAAADVVISSALARSSRPDPPTIHVEGIEATMVDVRRVLPVVPERHTFPLDFVHDAPMVKRAGGMPLIVEGLVELMPGAKVRFDRPETVPPPVRAVMKALRQRKPFYLVIGVGEEAWWVELKK